MVRPPDRNARYHFSGGAKPAVEPEDGLCSYVTTHPKRTTIQHWQLRDLIHCPRRAGEVYAVNRGRILRHDLTRPGRSHVAAELSFEPTCITAGSGYLAAGGQSSQLDVREAAPGSGTIVFKGYSGGSVNNALRITRDASHTLRLFLCNNDDTVKVFSLESGAMECVVRCPVAINHCALSPDGQRMVCVGDNRHTYLYQATPTGYRPLHVFTEAADAGMSCDWSPSGSIFAAASQDGLTCVWDHRTEEVISKFVTPLACRNVRFAPAPLDLLAFTEHRGRCHLADARVWPRQQVLHVGGLPELEPDISGLAFSPCGSMLYVGLEEGIVSYEVNSIGRRSFASAELA